MEIRQARKVWGRKTFLRLEPFKDLDLREDLKHCCPSASIRTRKHKTLVCDVGEPCPDTWYHMDGQVHQLENHGDKPLNALVGCSGAHLTTNRIVLGASR
jgi:hypothetical protein